MLTKTLCVAIATSALTAGAASAQNSDQLPSIRVSYSDLNLNSEAGAHAMYARLRNAAHNVCGEETGRRPISEVRAVRACVATALNSAVDALNQPLVTALNEQNHGAAHDVQFAQAAR